MSSFDDLFKKAHELRAKGLSDREIADELNLQRDTVVWLLLHEKERLKAPAPYDYSVNWSTIGSSTRRLSFIGSAIADLVRESISNGEFEDFDVVVGIELSGAPIGLIAANDLQKPFAVARAARLPSISKKEEKQSVGSISANFSSVEGKKVVLVTDVISTGIILREVIKSLREIHATPVGMVAFVDKRGGGKIEGVPVKSLVNMISLRK